MPHTSTLGWGVKQSDGAEIWDANPIFSGAGVETKDRLKLLFYPKKFFTYRFIEKDFKEKLKMRTLEEPYRVLDVGAGTGASVIDLKKLLGRRADVVGLDVVKLEVDIGKEKLKKHGVVGEMAWYDGGQFPFSSHSFDAVYTSDVLGHVPDVALWLGEISRVLKSDGILSMYAESALGSHAYIRTYLKERGVNIDPHAEFHISLHDKKTLQALLDEAGFEIEIMKSSFWAAFFVHPEEFAPKLQGQKRFFFLRMINKFLTFVKKRTYPYSTALAEMYGLVEMSLLGNYFDAQGFIVLARKKR